MRCLVVLAHPSVRSLNHIAAETALDALGKSGHEIRFVDLHRSGFDPRLTTAERESYYGIFDRSQLAAEIGDLQWAEAIVLVFPTWWFGPPAILKGWFDRVWAPSVAYYHAEDRGPIRPRLGDLKKVVVFTTLGSPWWVDFFVLRRPVRRVLKTAILRSCAPNAELEFVSFYKSERFGERAVAKMTARVRKTISHL